MRADARPPLGRVVDSGDKCSLRVGSRASAPYTPMMDVNPMAAADPRSDPGDDDVDLAGARRPRAAQLSGKAGLLPRQEIRNLVNRKVLRATQDFSEAQFQPASLDLRLGAKAYRVR